MASADHVRRGLAGGFMQVNHGKAAPLRRIHPGDRIAYYSPTAAFRAADGLKAFTAIGVVKAGEPYEAQMGDFRPFRRDVAWLAATDAPIAPLLDRLSFSAGVKNWGAKLRFGLLKVEDADMSLIAAAMNAALPG